MKKIAKDVEKELQRAEDAVEMPDFDVQAMLDDQDLLQQKLLDQLKIDVKSARDSQDKFAVDAELMKKDLAEIHKKVEILNAAVKK
ncbi:hypothetical protein SS50377_23854 [Spironucleus salmonicida]|uniref:Uncharacterized protein n=1 Tax=Spironucleus salmonicida TaxID=348837 RepID=V6LTQ1_9EUKA|nr:hypothetical protein SS50377_23854 [Spironucleus salmonicida]|eukprot:EST44154.1 Hypothetical protein SS50377_16058 [Spironucleus salmonicida]